jgi:hypothetical protein
VAPTSPEETASWKKETAAPMTVNVRHRFIVRSNQNDPFPVIADELIDEPTIRSYQYPKSDDDVEDDDDDEDDDDVYAGDSVGTSSRTLRVAMKAPWITSKIYWA